MNGRLALGLIICISACATSPTRAVEQADETATTSSATVKSTTANSPLPIPQPVAQVTGNDGYIVGLFDDPARSDGVFSSKLVVVAPDGTSKLVDPPMLVTGVFPSRAPNVAIVQLKDITFGVPYALFDAANERFLPLGDVVTCLDSGDRFGGPVQRGVLCTRGNRSTVVDVVGDVATWAVDVAPPCTRYVLSADGAWLAAVPSVIGGCTITQASRVKVRRLDGSMPPVELQTTVAPIAFNVQPGAFSPDGAWLLMGEAPGKVNTELLVADTHSGAVRRLGRHGELVGWVNGDVALFEDGEQLARVDVRSGERVTIRTAASVRAWCVSPGDPGTVVEIVDTLDGFNLAFLTLDGTLVREAKTKYEIPAACDKHERNRFTSPGWLWQISRRSEVYAIDAAGKRLVEFPELKARIDDLVFSAGPDGFAAVMSAMSVDQTCRSWLLVPTGQARPFEECWESVRFSPSGTRLLVGMYDARREGRAAVYSLATGAKERDLPAVRSPVWLRA